MDYWLSQLPQHGYSILMLAVFLETIGFPIPAALALLIAGAASARSALHPLLACGSALVVVLIGDTLMFLLGRHTGWWLLGVLCRLSLNPESCVLSAADSFYRRGRTLLIFAKFMPGINTMAPPLAGSMNMRFSQFLRLDMAGAALYIGAYFGLGYAFSDALGSITKGYQTFGHYLNWVLLAAVLGYLGVQIFFWIRARTQRSVPEVRPEDVAQAMKLFPDNLIFDVRSHGYYDPRATRIQGSRRLDPNSISSFEERVAETTTVYLYCTCVRQATSARVARVLIARNVRCAVIIGGLKAWQRAGLPVEPVPAAEMSLLPIFES